jgi:filamentous hemagglutinin
LVLETADPKTGVLTGSSPLDVVYTVRIPKGTTVYDGPVGPQGGFYVGGPNASQVFVETPWNIRGVQVLDARPIKGKK